MKINKQTNSFLPNLFILGAAKCGTTTLHDYLASMPEICMSNPKEPIFFECEFGRGIDYYKNKYFHHWKSEEIIGESRHRNLYLPYIPQRIYKTAPKSKLIIILRNPVDRAYSHWWYWYSRKMEINDFSSAIKNDLTRINKVNIIFTKKEIELYCTNLDKHGRSLFTTYVDSGYYFEQIKRFKDMFPKNNIKIILTENLLHTPDQTINDIRQFLGLKSRNFEIREIKKANISKLHYKADKLVAALKILKGKNILSDSIFNKSYRLLNRIYGRPTIDLYIRKFLLTHYLEHNKKLENYLNIDLSHWI